MKRSKLLALLGAAVLTVGTVGAALAEELKPGHQGITISWDENGDPVVEDGNGDPVDFGVNEAGDCLDEETGEPLAGEGEILIHFVQSPTDANSGTLDVDFDGATDINDQAQAGSQGAQLDWDVWATATGDSIVIVTANSSVGTGDKTLKISHLCVGEAPGDETTSTTSTETTSTETTSTETTSTETTTSFTSSQASTTDSSSSSSSETTSFSDSVSDSTTQPPTDTIGAGSTGQQSGGLWMLLAALGVLAGSVIVLAPSKAKNRD
jgi:hypothetical protein